MSSWVDFLPEDEPRRDRLSGHDQDSPQSPTALTARSAPVSDRSCSRSFIRSPLADLDHRSRPQQDPTRADPSRWIRDRIPSSAIVSDGQRVFLQAGDHLTAGQAWTNSGPTAREPSNQLSNNRHVRHRTLTDVDGRSFPGQACRSAGCPCRKLASGRRGRRFKSGHPDQVKHGP